MKLPLNSIISFQFIKVSVTSTARKLQNGLVSVFQWLTGPSHRRAALVYLPALALVLSLYLLSHIKEDTCVETADGSTNMSLTPLPKNSSIVTEPLQMELKAP